MTSHIKNMLYPKFSTLMAFTVSIAAATTTLTAYAEEKPEPQKSEAQNTHPDINTTIAEENTTPDWIEIPKGQSILPLGEKTKFYFNRNSVEHNPKNKNWRNFVAYAEFEQNEENAKRLGQEARSIMMRYTIDCAHDFILPVDFYIFDAAKVQGNLLGGQGFPQGPIKIESTADSVYLPLKKQVCVLSGSSPMPYLLAKEPEWQLISRPTPPLADQTFTYIDKKSIRTSVEHSDWKRVTMLTQFQAIDEPTGNKEQQQEHPKNSQVWQLTADCKQLQLRFDIAIEMEKVNAQGQMGNIGLSEEGFAPATHTQARKIIEAVCGQPVPKPTPKLN